MTIDHLGVGVRVLEVACRTDHGDSAFAYGDGGVPQDAGVAHLLSPSRSGRTGASHDLGCVDEEEILLRHGAKLTENYAAARCPLRATRLALKLLDRFAWTTRRTSTPCL